MSRAMRRQIAFVSVFLVVVLLFVTLFRMGIVRGNSMEPTYETGQVVLVRRRHGSTPTLHHNDVVLVRQNHDVIIKRVYRLEGEEMDGAFPYQIADIYRMNLADYYEQEPAITAFGQPPPRLFVPKGYLVVIGDNLRVSEDSRIFGPVPVRDVLGVVVNSPPPPYLANVQPDNRATPSEKTGR